MTSHRFRWMIDYRVSLISAVGFVILGIALGVPLLKERNESILKLSAGLKGTRRHAIAKFLSEQASQNGLTITLEKDTVTEECLKQVNAGEIDAAIVSNGVVVPDDDDIRVLASVQLEAVHVLVRKELVEGGPLAERIRGKRVNLGEKGSTEWLLSRDILAFGRIRLPTKSQPGDVIPTEFSKTELIAKARAILQAEGADKAALIAELPDCLLVLGPMPSMVVQSLVEAADYRIAPLPATRTFLMDNLQDERAKTTVLERVYLERTTIPANSYFTTRGFPAADCETIGVRMLVVAGKNVPASAIRPLMKTLFEGQFSQRVLPKSPRDLTTPYPIHPAAIAYLDRDKPLPVKELVESVSSGLSFLGIFSAGALSLYGLMRGKKVRKPSDYFAEIRKIDQIARGVELDPATQILPSDFTKHLDDRLLKLRQELIEDICEGRIKGDQVIANILALLKDVRTNLPNADIAEPGGNSPGLERSASRAA